MSVAWYLFPYELQSVTLGLETGTRQIRFPPILRYQAQVTAFSYAELLGNHILCKINAPDVVLTAIEAVESGWTRLPRIALGTTLSSLSNAQVDALIAKLQALGYTLAEVQAAMGTSRAQFRQRTLRQLLTFALTRKRAARYDETAGAIVFDGAALVCESLAAIDGRA